MAQRKSSAGTLSVLEIEGGIGEAVHALPCDGDVLLVVQLLMDCGGVTTRVIRLDADGRPRGAPQLLAVRRRWVGILPTTSGDVLGVVCGDAEHLWSPASFLNVSVRADSVEVRDLHGPRPIETFGAHLFSLGNGAALMAPEPGSEGSSRWAIHRFGVLHAPTEEAVVHVELPAAVQIMDVRPTRGGVDILWLRAGHELGTARVETTGEVSRWKLVVHARADAEIGPAYFVDHLEPFILFRHYNGKVKRETRDASLYAISEGAAPSRVDRATRLLADREVGSWRVFANPTGGGLVAWSSGVSAQTRVVRAAQLFGLAAIAQPAKLELMPAAAAVVGGRLLLFGWQPRPKDGLQRLVAFRADELAAARPA